MLDIQALPIAFALSLWDAAPIYFSVGLVLAILTRAILSGQSFHRTWAIREMPGIEGIAYAALFMPVLVPLLAIAGGLNSALRLTTDYPLAESPATPGAALRARSEEIFVALLIGSAVAAVIKIGAPSVPDTLIVAIGLSILAGMLTGIRSGAVALPAVAAAVHLGGFLPATLCISAAVSRSLFVPAIQERARRSPTD